MNKLSFVKSWLQYFVDKTVHIEHLHPIESSHDGLEKNGCPRCCAEEALSIVSTYETDSLQHDSSPQPAKEAGDADLNSITGMTDFVINRVDGDQDGKGLPTAITISKGDLAARYVPESAPTPSVDAALDWRAALKAGGEGGT